MDPTQLELCELRLNQESLLTFIESVGMASAYQIHRINDGLDPLPSWLLGSSNSRADQYANASPYRPHLEEFLAKDKA